jgi:hydroxyacylglutathione hydrolase
MQSLLRGMEVVIVPVLQDNFAYLLVDKLSSKCAVIDPAEPQLVLNAVAQRQLQVEFVLTTHHHWDHAGGNTGLLGLLGRSVPVYGGDERIDAVSHLLKDKEVVRLGEIEITTLSSPCHTTGHVLYHCQAPSSVSALFTGDTLFVGGCGRFFEGTADQMHHALNTVIADLPDATNVYCGHEYALNNLGFALTIEPTNEYLIQKVASVKATLAAGGHSVPSSVGEEKLYNPFMRVHTPTVRKGLGLGEDSSIVSVMAALREAKNKWKG